MTDSTYSWSKGMRADSIQLSNRLQTIIRFQIANDLQVFLNQVLSPNMQLLGIVLLIVCTELGVRRLNMYSFTLIRAVVVIQSGQCLLQYIDSIDGDKALSAGVRVHATSWLITTAALCIPGMLNNSFQQDTYMTNAITVFLYQYTAATKDTITQIDLGISPLYIAVLCVMLAVRLQFWNEKRNRMQSTSLFVYYFKAFHMLVVELLLFSLQDVSAKFTAFSQVMIQMIVILCIDTLNQKHVLEEVRGYTIWRLSRLLLALKFQNFVQLDAMMTSAVAVIIFLSRRLPFVHSLYTSAQSLHTLAEIVFLTSMNLILRPIAAQNNSNVAIQLLLILFISTIAQSVEMLVRT